MYIPRSLNTKHLALLIAFVLIASFDSVFKYTGFLGLAAYVVLGSAALFVYFRYLFPVLFDRVSESAALFFAISIALILLIGTFFLYDLANSGAMGPGSDQDDALIIGVTEILNGRYPFYPRTYLGNPIAPMPGALFFALPFVALDVFPLHGLAFLISFFVVVGLWAKSLKFPLFLGGPILLVSPTIFQNLASGADHIANSVYILFGSLLIIGAARRPSSPWWMVALPAALLGIGLSSRSNFLFLMPLLFVLMSKLRGVRYAALVSALAAAAFLAVTLPFYLYDPSGFTPLHVQTLKMDQFNGILPNAGLVLTASSLALSTFLAFRQRSERTDEFLRSLAYVQLFVLLFTSALYSVSIDKFNLYFGHIGYGHFVMFFGVFAQSLRMMPAHLGMDSAAENE